MHGMQMTTIQFQTWNFGSCQECANAAQQQIQEEARGITKSPKL